MELGNGHIGGLFQSIRSRLQKHLVDRAAIQKIVLEEAKISLKEDDIVFKKGVLTLKLSPLKKAELQIKKEAIQGRIASETSLVVLEIR